jgi:hypothetical protein
MAARKDSTRTKVLAGRVTETLKQIRGQGRTGAQGNLIERHLERERPKGTATAAG